MFHRGTSFKLPPGSYCLCLLVKYKKIKVEIWTAFHLLHWSFSQKYGYLKRKCLQNLNRRPVLEKGNEENVA